MQVEDCNNAGYSTACCSKGGCSNGVVDYRSDYNHHNKDYVGCNNAACNDASYNDDDGDGEKAHNHNNDGDAYAHDDAFSRLQPQQASPTPIQETS